MIKINYWTFNLKLTYKDSSRLISCVNLVVISFFLDQIVLLMISALAVAMQQTNANDHNLEDNHCSLKTLRKNQYRK